MAGEAFGRLGLGIGEFLAEDEDSHASLATFFHVGCSRAMTGFTTFLAGWAAGNNFLGMN